MRPSMKRHCCFKDRRKEGRKVYRLMWVFEDLNWQANSDETWTVEPLGWDLESRVPDFSHAPPSQKARPTVAQN